MIVLDTDVVSEMMRDTPDRHVLAWVDIAKRLHTTVITLAEVDYAIARLPAGRRKDGLTRAASEIFADFDDVILPFDARAGRRYAGIVVARERAGRPIAAADAQIAAICASRWATLATRNIGDFEGTGIELIDPWSD